MFAFCFIFIKNGAAVNENGRALEFVHDSLRDSDREIILAAVRQDGTAIRLCCNFNKEIALEAVKQNGLALGYLSDSLKKDKEVVLAA